MRFLVFTHLPFSISISLSVILPGQLYFISPLLNLYFELIVLQMAVLLIKGLLRLEMVYRKKKKKKRFALTVHMKAQRRIIHSYQVSSKLKNMSVAEHWEPIGESFVGNQESNKRNPSLVIFETLCLEVTDVLIEFTNQNSVLRTSESSSSCGTFLIKPFLSFSVINQKKVFSFFSVLQGCLIAILKTYVVYSFLFLF